VSARSNGQVHKGAFYIGLQPQHYVAWWAKIKR
jgi:hypothetical protein